MRSKAAKKVIFFNGSAVPLRRGGGRGRAIKEKELFFDGEVPTAIKLERGGGLRP